MTEHINTGGINMINITFSDSLAGCLKMADYYSKKRNSEIQDLKENLFSLYLNLDLGDISEQLFGEKRENDFGFSHY